ncbi:MAG: hypothetical protein GY869_32830 [Planctomycetes bacterium]|nr:hypothetical protein [Planctomycetota bacterium]
MTYGTALFWIRFRIATAVTTVPVFEQFKLHTSRFEVNEDGVTEYFGNGRYPRELEIHQRLTDDLQGASPGSQAINYASGITLTLVDNRFSDNTIDGFGGVLPIPIGLDTSIPIVFSLGWIPSVNTAGNVELEMDVAQTQVGDTLDGTLSTVNTPVVVPINAQQDEFIITQFSITVDEVVPGEFISYKTFRDATGGNIHDTLSGNAEIVSWSAYGYFWRP